MKKQILALQITFITVLALTACGDKKNPVIARAGSIVIRKAEFEKELINLPPVYLNYLSTIEGKKQFLDILLRERILSSAAEKSGVAKKPEIIKNLREYRERAKQQEKDFRKSLIMKQYLRDLQDTELRVTEADIKTHFEQNKADFTNPQKVSASHILTTSQPDAEKALQRVKKGEDFAKVAKEISTDPSAIRGGMIGEVVKGDLADIPDFETKLFSLKTGEVSDIVKTKMGFHIIKKTGQFQMPGQTFEQSVPQIRRLLEKKKFDQWVEKVKKEKNVWTDDKLIASVSLPKPEPEPESEESEPQAAHQ